MTTPAADTLHVLFIGTDRHTAELQWRLTETFGEILKADVYAEVEGARAAVKSLAEGDKPITAAVAVIGQDEPGKLTAEVIAERLAALGEVGELSPHTRRLVQLGPQVELPPQETLRKIVPHQVYRAPLKAGAFLEHVLHPLLDTSETLREETLRSATIRAKDDVQLLRIPKTTFQDLLTRSPEIAIGIVRELSLRLRKLQNAQSGKSTHAGQ